MHDLGKYLLKRGLLALLTLLAILFASYVLIRLAPGDPTKSSMLGENANLSAEKSELGTNELMRKKLHLDKSAAEGFYLWLREIVLHGDFGSSVSVDKGRPVTQLILEKLPVTLKLNFLAILVTYLLAVPIGILAGVYKESVFDRITSFLLFFLYSLPALWSALMLQAILCKGGILPLFPLKGLEPEIVPGMSTWAIAAENAKHFFLPVLCLSYAGLAGLSRYTRSAMIDVMQQEYIKIARAKGLAETAVIFQHAFRNTFVVLATILGGLLPGLVSGSILIEYVFSIPGMGSLSMLALSSRDIPLLMALFAFTGILTLAGMLLSDILYVLVDPRISFQSKKL